MRDLSLVPAGYIFSKNGHFLVKKVVQSKEDKCHQYFSILADACLGMKFDPELRLYVLELRGVGRLKSKESHSSDSSS